MTPIEIRDALREIESVTDTRAYAGVAINGGIGDQSDIVTAFCYPKGVGDKHCIRAVGDDFRQALDRLRMNVTEALNELTIARIREMAQQIIATTYDSGACTEAALRGHGFAQSEIDKFGARAVEEADDMAKGGPFQIKKVKGNKG